MGRHVILWSTAILCAVLRVLLEEYMGHHPGEGAPGRLGGLDLARIH